MGDRSKAEARKAVPVMVEIAASAEAITRVIASARLSGL